jgi:hypothetical protein
MYGLAYIPHHHHHHHGQPGFSWPSGSWDLGPDLTSAPVVYEVEQPKTDWTPFLLIGGAIVLGGLFLRGAR